MASVFSTAYLPPLVYFEKLIKEKFVQLEVFENFQKQTIRNRCFILSSNGIQCLSIPVHQPSGKKQLIQDTAIKNDIPWQRLHWRTLISAYNRSPFFEFYKDDLSEFFLTRNYKWLLEFNNELMIWILKNLKTSMLIEQTSLFDPSPENDFRPLSNARSPLVETNQAFKKYNQVFSYKFGFVQNLSIIDLLFNMGNHSLAFLSESFH